MGVTFLKGKSIFLLKVDGKIMKDESHPPEMTLAKGSR